MGVRRHSHNLYLTTFVGNVHIHKLQKCNIVEYIIFFKLSFTNLHFNTLLHKTWDFVNTIGQPFKFALSQFVIILSCILIKCSPKHNVLFSYFVKYTKLGSYITWFNSTFKTEWDLHLLLFSHYIFDMSFVTLLRINKGKKSLLF